MCFENELNEVKANVQGRKRSRKMVVIPIAHSYRSPGVKNEQMVLDEYQFSTVLTTRVVNMLNSKNVCKALILDYSYMTSYNETLRSKIQEVNSMNPKLALEIHLNGSYSPQARGFETLHVSNKGKQYAELVHQRLADFLTESIDRGIKKRTNLMFLNATTCPALILEPLFLSNSSEAIRLTDEKFINGLSEAIYLGIKDVIES
jgi:N-acetylmuramoyl-L-alanine amidase